MNTLIGTAVTAVPQIENLQSLQRSAPRGSLERWFSAHRIYSSFRSAVAAVAVLSWVCLKLGYRKIHWFIISFCIKIAICGILRVCPIFRSQDLCH